MFGFTIGQIIPIELSNREVQRKFYQIGFLGIPFFSGALILSLLKKSDSNRIKSLKILGGMLTTIGIFAILMNFIFAIGFSAWKDYNLLYVNKKNPNHKIIEQICDQGAFGYGGYRTIETKPVLLIFKTTNPKEEKIIDEEMWKEKNEHLLFKEWIEN